MAARDIMPYKSPLGGSYEVRHADMTAGEVFEVGEPVMVVNAGTLTEPTDNAAQWTEAQHTATGTSAVLGGIAAWGPGAGNIDPQTGAAFTTGGDIGYYPFNQGTLFFTTNFFAAGAAADATPALTDIGEIYQITYNTTATIGWGVEQTAGTIGTDVCARINDVLDSTGTSVNDPLYNGTAASVLFEITVA